MNLRNMTLYSVFIRNHGGTFRKAAEDMARIRELGVDAIWLMPIHPLGEKARKGSLGSPYAIRDYRAVNPEYGTMEDFQFLVDTIHHLGMKVMIDVVYNHTSPDSWLAAHHPEWFFHKADGSFGNRVGDWTDIVDLDYSHRGLWDYQIETLKMWAAMVDGFRCDVAPLVPVAFWKEARAAVETVRPGCIWLAESVEGHFIRYMREQGINAHSDSEMYQAFDICYDYDVLDDYMGYVRGEIPLCQYLAALERQESIYPASYVKLRCLENHDRARMACLFPEKRVQENWLAFMFLQKGMPMLYSGQEWAPAHRPTLFDADPVDMTGVPVWGDTIRRLTALKKDPIFAQGAYRLKALPKDVAQVCWRQNGETLLGLCSLQGQDSLVQVEAPDGCYENLLTGEAVQVECGHISLHGHPVAIRW